MGCFDFRNFHLEGDHAKDEDPQGHQKEISLDCNWQGKAPQSGNQPFANSNVSEA
jgi:hypothetical protein